MWNRTENQVGIKGKEQIKKPMDEQIEKPIEKQIDTPVLMEAGKQNEDSDDPELIRIYLLRHGSTPSNREHRYLGWTEQDLSTEGIKELENLTLPLVTFDLTCSSPMRRCRQSLDILLQRNGQIINSNEIPDCNEEPARYEIPARNEIPARYEIPDWKEMNFGDFENLNYQELNGNPDYQAWIDSGGTIAFPGGEDRNGFISRVMNGYEEFLKLVREKNPSSVLVLVHGGTIMALLSALTEGDYFDYQVKNGRGYVFSITRDGQIRGEIEKI